MQIQIASKGIDVSQALRERISEKLEEMMDKYIHRDGDAQVSVAREGSGCLLYTSPSPRDQRGSRMPSSA